MRKTLTAAQVKRLPVGTNVFLVRDCTGQTGTLWIIKSGRKNVCRKARRMNREEAIRKITFAREGYLKLIEENVSEGQFVGDDIIGEWRSGTSLNDVYQQMADAMGMAIKALEQPEPCEDDMNVLELCRGISCPECPFNEWESGCLLDKRIHDLPSVMPKCTEDYCPMVFKPESCEDAVSRHRLLNDLEELTTAWEKYPVMAEQIKGVETAIGYVKTIPPVTPKQRLIPCGKCVHADGKHRWCKVLDRTINEDYFCYWAESYREEGGK